MSAAQEFPARRMLSLVIPIYRNEPNLPRLFEELEGLAARLPGGMEAVFVVDGSPDHSLELIERRIADWRVPAQALELSRNFGSFAAITAGLAAARGGHFAVLAADLQEPPELILAFQRALASGDCDVAIGRRERREDPWWTRLPATVFWALFRRYVVRDMPPGGVDVFGCTRQVRDQLLALPEAQTSLVALLFWLGYRREFFPYERRARQEGRSAWTFGRRLRYAADSIFGFTDIPVRVLLAAGTLGTAGALLSSLIVLAAWLRGAIPVLGYTPLMLVIAFFGGLTTLGLGIIGQYTWLTLQNARRRPNYLVRAQHSNGVAPGAGS